jgi:hypothetical protein
MWILSQEAVLLKNSDFLKKVLTLRDYQRALQTSQILRELKQSFKVNFGDKISPTILI